MKIITTNLLNRFWKNGVKPIKAAVEKKLDTAKVINNLLTTAPGYALDARQGKVLQDQVDVLNTGIDSLYRHSDVIYDGSGAQISPASDYIQLTSKRNLVQYAFLIFDVRTASSVGDWNAQLMPIISIMQGVLPMVYSAPTANCHFKTSFMFSGDFEDNTAIAVFVQDNPVTVRIFGIY